MNDKRTTSGQRVIPLAREEVKIGKKTRETGIARIRKIVREKEERIDQPLGEEEVLIEHVPINRFVEAPVPVRQEEEVTIIPLFEEVAVVEKKLLLKEELHIRKQTRTIHKPQKVVLRREEAVVEHIDRESGADAEAPDKGGENIEEEA